MLSSCVLRLLLIWKQSNANSTCRKTREKLSRLTPHTIIIHCGTKSDRIARPNTLTDSYTRFLPKTQSYTISMTRTPKSIPNKITLPKYTCLNLLVDSVRYLIFFCWSTACFITLLSYTQHFYNAELYPILTYFWGVPLLLPCWPITDFTTLPKRYQSYHIVEVYSPLTHCWAITYLSTLSNCGCSKILLSVFTELCRQLIRTEYYVTQ